MTESSTDDGRWASYAETSTLEFTSRIVDGPPPTVSVTVIPLPLSPDIDSGDASINPTSTSSLSVIGKPSQFQYSSNQTTPLDFPTTSSPSTYADIPGISASFNAPTFDALTLDTPASANSSSIISTARPSPTIATNGMQRGIKCVAGLFIETNGDLYNLTCDAQASGNRIFANFFDNIMQCAKQCSIVRKGGEECDSVIFNQKNLRKRAPEIIERAPLNCYGLTRVVGSDVKLLVDTAVFVDNTYTKVNGGVVLGPALPLPAYPYTPPIAAPTMTFSDAVPTTTPNFYSPYVYPTSSEDTSSISYASLWVPPGILSPSHKATSLSSGSSNSPELTQTTSSPQSTTSGKSEMVSNLTDPTSSTSVPLTTTSDSATVAESVFTSSSATSITAYPTSDSTISSNASVSSATSSDVSDSSVSASSTSSPTSSAPPTSSTSACPIEELITNGGFLNGSLDYWSLIADLPATGDVQQNPSNASDYEAILTALNDASTDYSQSELTQSIPGLCYNSTYTLTLTHKLTVDLTQNNDRGECDVSLELGDQTITLLYADTNGAESTPFPANEERDHIPFVYQRKGQDDPNTFTVALYCIKANMQATYTLDDISLSGPRCCEGGPVITEIAGAGNGTGP